MDVTRAKSTNRKKQVRVIIIGSLVTLAIAFVTFAISQLKPAAPTAERSTLIIDTVKRGPMLRQIRGTGTLVPEDVRVIAASTQGLVERIMVQPGAEVSAGTVLLELSNPELQQSVVDSEFQLNATEADYNSLKAKLESELLAQRAAAAAVRSEYEQAKILTDTDEVLARDGLIPALSLKLSRVRTAEMANRYQIEQQRVQSSIKGTQAQFAAQQARIAQIRALLQLKRGQVATLRVLAGTGGVLQEMQVEVGQQVTPGTNLAKVVEPQNLKAQLKIAETQAKDIQLNQEAKIDTRNGIVTGHVVRIDPAAQQGTVTLDVAFDGQLPQGARPDSTVDGTIELERLNDVVYMGRPVSGQAQSVISMFKLEPDGKNAVRVQVKLGRSSVNAVEVLEGLQPGDQVILSDTSAWDNYNSIRLN